MNMEEMENALQGGGYEYVARRYLDSGLGRPDDAALCASVWEKPGGRRVVILGEGQYGDGASGHPAQLFAPAQLAEVLNDDYVREAAVSMEVHATDRSEVFVLRAAELGWAERHHGSPGVVAIATDEELGIRPEEPLEGYDDSARYRFRGVEFVGRQKHDGEGAVFRLAPEEAARLVREHGHGLPTAVMCREYGDDEDWAGMTPDDLREDGLFDPDYKTFEFWLLPSEAAEVEVVST